jgi:16S rRNA (cytosine1402-N4)-methyltransferase
MDNKGTHPRSFKEKYKELQPERYSEDIEKPMQQGRTPPGMHLSICVDEIIKFLKIVPRQTGLDATLGYGGHSLEILKCLAPGGHLYAIDVGPLDLRLNPKSGKSAATLLKTISQHQLEELFIENADESYSELIAKAIIAKIAKGTLITTTAQLKEIIKKVLEFLP